MCLNVFAVLAVILKHVVGRSTANLFDWKPHSSFLFRYTNDAYEALQSILFFFIKYLKKIFAETSGIILCVYGMICWICKWCLCFVINYLIFHVELLNLMHVI